MNIALIGARGSGKTTVAKLLGEKLGRKVIDLDDLISIEEKGKKIPEIIKEKGWHYFRDLEYLVVKKAVKHDNVVISCGGGVVTDLDQEEKQIYSQRKVDALKESSIVIWLKVTPEVACQRIGDDPNRPSLTGNKTALEEMEDIIKLRNPWYEKASDYSFDSSIMNPEELVSEIEKLLVNFKNGN